ncbi:UDP-glucose flavonoid 3-O-glucosyltransferase [Medicago truncatula]|uniref:UDP-glucose flavonoid 3-O-glucosyltransferase n=1 Tax=Medicago truncatula TaxID=3880 RepID=G7K390_MEDTR|nr:UDP-glucose flavonoid 3-O-glucosyltransferase [Medicago truncatula]
MTQPILVAQGQSLKQVDIYLPEPVFSHKCYLPPNFDLVSAINALLEAQKPNIIQAVSNLTTREGQHGHLSAFVVDMFCTTMIDVANEFNVPTLVFYTFSVASLGLNLYLHTLRERDNIDLTQLLQEKEAAIPSFANPIPSNPLPSFVRNKEREPFFMSLARGLKKIYPVGPLLNPEPKTKGTVDADSDDIMKWLHNQPPSSVVFLCFGSRGYFDEDQVKEIAHVVENSGARFVWSLRKPLVKGTMAAPSDYSLYDLGPVLPEGFLDRTAEIGRIIRWAQQAQILAHPAIGGFVSHYGWNSTLESIYFDRCVEIALDYRMEFSGESNYLVSADKIERVIRSVLYKDGEVKKKVKKMSEKSRKTLLEGGSSYTYLAVPTSDNVPFF